MRKGSGRVLCNAEGGGALFVDSIVRKTTTSGGIAEGDWPFLLVSRTFEMLELAANAGRPPAEVLRHPSDQCP